MEQYRGLLGVLVLLGLAFALSTDRRRVPWRLVGAGLLLQLCLAWLFLSFAPVAAAFERLARVVTKMISFADEGTAFIFGSAADASQPWGFIFAVKVLPIIIFFASFMAVLYHLGVMQRIVAALAWVLRRTMRITGAEALCAAANIFVGQTEAPLMVRPYIARMTRSQLMALMSTGFATIAGSVMAAYIGILGGDDEQSRVTFAVHLMTASVMSAPAGLVMAKVMLPETEQPPEESLAALAAPRETRNVLDAAAAGATDGLRLALNVAAMLVAFVALLALLNWPIHELGEVRFVREWREQNGIPPFSIELLLGTIFRPIAWSMGVPWGDCGLFGSLLGKQLIATEFVAYLSLGKAVHEAGISPRAAHIATYALCGFANFPSIAIQIGGLSALAPERRAELASLGLRAMTAGAFACWSTGAIASLFIPA